MEKINHIDCLWLWIR